MSDDYEPTGIDLVLESVNKIVVQVEESLQSGTAIMDQVRLRTNLVDLRASYFAFLYEQQEADEHG